ncbi:hypothetical protein WDW89_00095 [Deltaproteobacteria bacterium TL4]
MRAEGLDVSPWIVEQLLKKHGYSYRFASKSLSIGQSEFRDEQQFENIARLKEDYEKAGNPIISIDAKKKRH